MELEGLTEDQFQGVVNIEYANDLAFTKAVKKALGDQVFKQHRGEILKAGAHMNAYLILFGILGFVASFAFSLGPVMWVMLSELFPNKVRALAIGAIGFINSFTSWLIQQIFPWEISTFGNATTYFIFALFGIIGFILMYRLLPETKGKSLEELEEMLVTKN